MNGSTGSLDPVRFWFLAGLGVVYLLKSIYSLQFDTVRVVFYSLVTLGMVAQRSETLYEPWLCTMSVIGSSYQSFGLLGKVRIMK